MTYVPNRALVRRACRNGRTKADATTAAERLAALKAARPLLMRPNPLTNAPAATDLMALADYITEGIR